jgi:hypothetical protein
MIELALNEEAGFWIELKCDARLRGPPGGANLVVPAAAV